VIPADLSEIIALADSIYDKDAISQTVSEIKGYGRVDCTGFQCDVERGLEKTARFTLAVSQWMSENECVAGSIQCWDSIEKNYGCASCLTMSILGEKGMPFACETDIQGAVAMYALYLAGGNPSGYLDWNNSYGENRDMCINFHCSNYPKSFFGFEPVISCLDILGESLGYNNCFGALKAQVKSGNFTFANVQTDDINGMIKMYVGEGKFVDEPVNTVGSPAVCRVSGLQTLLKYLCKNGFHHHVAMNRGSNAAIIEEVFGNYFGWDVYRNK
jgi:L-fucose isomerase-like protein